MKMASTLKAPLALSVFRNEVKENVSNGCGEKAMKENFLKAVKKKESYVNPHPFDTKLLRNFTSTVVKTMADTAGRLPAEALREGWERVGKTFGIICLLLCATSMHGSETFPKKATKSVAHHKKLKKKYNAWLKGSKKNKKHKKRRENHPGTINDIIKAPHSDYHVEGYEGVLPEKQENVREVVKAFDLGKGDMNCYIERIDETRGHYHSITSYQALKPFFFWYMKGLYEQRNLTQPKESKGQ